MTVKITHIAQKEGKQLVFFQGPFGFDDEHVICFMEFPSDYTDRKIRKWAGENTILNLVGRTGRIVLTPYSDIEELIFPIPREKAQDLSLYMLRSDLPDWNENDGLCKHILGYLVEYYTKMLPNLKKEMETETVLAN